MSSWSRAARLAGIWFILLPAACLTMHAQQQPPAKEHPLSEPAAPSPPAVGAEVHLTKPAVQAFAYTPLTGKERAHYYLRGTFGPSAAVRSSLGAGINQARDSTPEWGQGMEGYSRRLASKFGQHVLKRSIHHGLAALLREDPRYLPSGKSGFLPRTGSAIAQTFMAYTDNGGRRVAGARFLGAFGAGLLSRTWHPEREHTAANGFRTGAFLFLTDIGWNCAKEFWPEIRRLFRH